MEEQRSEVSEALERLIFLSDGVFAIAITLLVLEIIPLIPAHLLQTELSSLLLSSDLWKPIATYALSFIILSVYGTTHQRIFHYIKRADNVLIWLNVFFLLLWWYATSNHRLVEKQLDAALIRHHMQRALIGPLIFVLSIASPSSIRFLLR